MQSDKSSIFINLKEWNILQISIYYNLSSKDLKIDVTDIMSFKNNLKFEVQIELQDKIIVLDKYHLQQKCEDDEYSFYLIFDLKNINIQEIKSLYLTQFKRQYFSDERIIYYNFKII